MSWFRRSSNSTTFDWKILTSEDQFLTLLNENPKFAVFKHSTRCSISSMAKKRLERNWDLDDSTPIYYLDLIQYRSLSNLIAERSGVIHQSPQLILFIDGKANYNASHNSISVDEIKASR